MSEPGGTTRLRFRCQCGASVSAPAAAVGRKARCPTCGAVQRIPALTPPAATPPHRLETDATKTTTTDDLDDLFPSLPKSPPVESTADAIYSLAPDQSAPSPPRSRVQAPAPEAAPPKVCPACHNELPATAKICVQCGIDLKTGREIQMIDDDHLNQAYVVAENIVRFVSWPAPLGFAPFASEAFGTRTPWVIRSIGMITVVVSLWYLFAVIYEDHPSVAARNLMQWNGRVAGIDEVRDEVRRALREEHFKEAEIEEALASWEPEPTGEFHYYQLITAAFLHGGFWHLAGNLVFLFVFGSRINALIGNLLTLAVYPLLAIASGLIFAWSVHDEPRSAYLGASGAIMGLAGMYFILFPVTKVHMIVWCRPWFFLILKLFGKMFAVWGFVVVLFYISFDVWSTVRHIRSQTAHWAHIGGFVAGAVLALVLMFSRLVNARGCDLLSVALGRHAWKIFGPPNRRGLSLP